MKKIIVGLCLVLTSNLLVAQPSSSSFIKTSLENKLDSLFEPFNNAQSPGCAVLVLQNGKVLVEKNYGMASIEHEIPFTPNHVARMGYSETREFICIAAVLMEKDGLLSLNDRVRKYFPELPAWSEPVTIWDLINHHSGFVDEWSTLLLMHGSMADRFDKSQFLNLLYNQPMPEVEPGKGYMYSNSDFGLLRLILEKASGENLAAYVQRRIFAPLGMTASRMHDNMAEVIPNFALKYSPISNGKYELWLKDKSSPGGNYYIATTANDLQRWAAVQADSVSEISKAVAKLLQHGCLLPGKTGHYSFGQTVTEINGIKAILHEGVNGQVYLTSIPERNMAIIITGNFREGFGFENQALLEFLLDVPKVAARKTFLTQPMSISPKELEQYAGRYVWQNQTSWESYSEKRILTDFFVENGQFKGVLFGSTYAFTPVGKGIFYWKDEYGVQLVFSQLNSETPMQLAMHFDDGYPSSYMVKESNEIWKPSTKELEALVGTYYSPHLDYHWHIELNINGLLVLLRPTMADHILSPDRKGEFTLKIEKYPGMSYDAWVRFHGDENGRITHLTVWHPRLMYHRFEKVSRQTK